MRLIISFFICLLILTVTGCKQYEERNYGDPTIPVTTHNLTAKDILVQNPNADIFQFNGIIYSNASNIEWVQQTELATGNIVVTITKQYKDSDTFEDSMATQLPIGTEIYEPLIKSGPILIVKLSDKEVRYLGLIEG